jgi:two-component system, cell cycle response regulator DivK
MGDLTIATPPGDGAAVVPHVLLVEDDPDSREMYAIALIASGFRVDQAENARGALEHLGIACPDVAVLDIALPGTDGIDLCRAIRSFTQTETPALVALTGLTLGRAEAARLTDAGFDALLFKPCLPEQLVAEVRRLLMRSARLQQDAKANFTTAAARVQASIRILEDCSRTLDSSERLRRQT